MPDYVGQGPASANVASLRNRGVELALTYRDAVGKLGYSANVNLTAINNKHYQPGWGQPHRQRQRAFANSAILRSPMWAAKIAYFYGLQDEGIFHNQGEIDAYKNAAGTLIQPQRQTGRREIPGRERRRQN